MAKPFERIGFVYGTYGSVLGRDQRYDQRWERQTNDEIDSQLVNQKGC